MKQELVRTRDLHSLPPEIIKQILCNISSIELLELKERCPFWETLISNMLDIETLPCPETITSNALNIFESWGEDDIDNPSLSMHRMSYSIKNVISIPLINTLMYNCLHKLDLVSYRHILDELKKHAENGGPKTKGPNDVIGAVWKSILGMTGLDYSVDKLRDLNFDDPFVSSFMSRYSWYTYETCGMGSIDWDVGIIALYPDNQRFVILLATDDEF